MTRYLILTALLAVSACDLPAEPPTQSIAEFRDRVRDREERTQVVPKRAEGPRSTQSPQEAPETPAERPEAPKAHEERVEAPEKAAERPRTGDRHWYRDDEDDDDEDRDDKVRRRH